MESPVRRSPRRSPPTTPDASIVAVERFILATRDSGYRGTPSAVAELVDNALQAGARRVTITIARDDDGGRWPLVVRVLDDGEGMAHGVLRQALRFGGSSRFNDRRGLGRFGMGLPNSSLSQAQRVEVVTWQGPRRALFCYLDIDEIVSGTMQQVPLPVPCVLPAGASDGSGTLVTWRRCDRLDHKRIPTIAEKLKDHLGRVFRYFLVGGVAITINGAPVEPVDPLFLEPRARWSGARAFGAPLRYRVAVQPESAGEEIAGEVVVQFSELPVQEWHELSNAEKQARGVSKGAGVSIVRAGREIDHGWFFMGEKRKENYDDWWRCEIRFEPALDDLFGITHTKQQVRPGALVTEILTQDLEATARALNARVRRAHEVAKVRQRLALAERRASAVEPLLPPLPAHALEVSRQAEVERLARRFPGLLGGGTGARYRLLIDALPGTRLLQVYPLENLLLVALNSQHPFYSQIYGPLLDGGRPEDEALRSRLDLLLLAAARAEAAEDRQPRVAQALAQRWSDALAEFLKEEARG